MMICLIPSTVGAARQAKKGEGILLPLIVIILLLLLLCLLCLFVVCCSPSATRCSFAPSCVEKTDKDFNPNFNQKNSSSSKDRQTMTSQEGCFFTVSRIIIPFGSRRKSTSRDTPLKAVIKFQLCNMLCYTYYCR